jgi:DNA-binding XRE family transcriptional regulator
MPKLTLEAARVNAGYTQTKLAEILDVSRATVNAWERGRVPMKPHYVFAFCHVVGVSEDDILLPKMSTESEQEV